MFDMKFTQEQIEQKRKARKFSVPYNNEDPIKYIEKVLDPYLDNIDSVYFEIPNIVLRNHMSLVATQDVNVFFKKQRNTYQFAELVNQGKYKAIKKYVTLNGASYSDMSFANKYVFVGNYLSEMVKSFNVTGFICADFELAYAIHQIFPQVEIQTSCNTYQWLTRTMDLWHKSLGTTTFNPPREILRDMDELKKIAKSGYRLKCLVNEACVYGCPQNINHAHYIADGSRDHEFYCNFIDWDVSDIFRTNFILPRHLKYYDDYVDLFKISGRSNPTNKIATFVDAYVNERNDVSLDQLITTRRNKRFKQAKKHFGFTIPVNRIPDKLLTCKCAECDTCDVCDKVAEKLMKQANMSSADFKSFSLE